MDILVNNAGIVYGQTLLELPDSAIENTYKVNILSHYWVRIRMKIWTSCLFIYNLFH